MSNKRKALKPVYTTKQAQADLDNRLSTAKKEIDIILEKYEFGLNLALSYSKEGIKPSIEFVNQKKYNIKDTPDAKETDTNKTK